jgi:hypothetical protein
MRPASVNGVCYCDIVFALQKKADLFLINQKNPTFKFWIENQ